jgi:Methylamine utilisation protein MauE
MTGLFQLRSQGVFNILRRVLGIILLVAAGLKYREIQTREGSSVVFDALEYGWIGLELLLGAVLVTDRVPRPAWQAAFAFFSVVAGVAGAKAFSGSASCGCFGDAALSPWLVFAGDLLAVLLLCAFPPRITRLSPPPPV